MLTLLARKARRDMRARLGQFAAVTVIIFIGVALFALSYDAYRNLVASYDRVFVVTRFADFTASGGDVESIVAAGRALPGVDVVSERRVADVPIKVGDHKLLGRLVGLPPGEQPPINGVMVLEGDYLSSDQPDGVLVEKHMAEHFGLRPGSGLAVQTGTDWEPLKMRGEAASAEYLWPARSRQEVLVSTDDFGVLFVPDPLLDRVVATAVVRQALFRYEAGADRAKLDTALRAAALAGGAVDSYAQADQPSNAALNEDISGFGEMAIMFPILFLGAAMMASYILLTRLVFSQRAQIGLLLANGFRRRTVFLHYLSFGIVTGLAGAVPGVVVGMLLARVATRFYTDAVSVPLNVMEFHPLTLGIGLAFGLGAGALATLAPALRAMRFTPAESMRGSAGPASGRRSPLERALPPLRRLPTRWKMVLRGISRSRRRSLLTVLGIVFAAVLVLSSWGMIDTMSVLLDRQFNQIQSQDAEVYLTPGQPEEAVARVAAVPGIALTEPVADQPASLQSATGSYSTALQAFEPATTMHRFLLVGGDETALPADGILLGAALRDLLSVSEGDSVRVALPSLDTTFAVRIAGFVDEPLGTFAYMSLPALRAASGSGSDPVNAAMVVFAPGADASAVREELNALPQVAAVIDSRALYATAQSYMGLF
ncbi:MAG TPA: ABC transporter permease, partial [Dehalococcoidia bacterium]|nr:ABC transporter permease [Dehalococcoidia bacterium]